MVRELVLISGAVVAAVLWFSAGASAAGRGITETSSSPHARLRSVDLDAVRWTRGFWADKARLCPDAMLPAVYRALSDPRNAAVLDNFRVAALRRGSKPAAEKGRHRGTNWSDGDCYKYLEAAAHVYALTRDPKLDRLMDRWIDLIARAQAPDGYLSTNIQLTPKRRFSNTHHHELYNMGHLLTAACIHHRATGKDRFLAVARKLGDFLYKTFQPRPPALAHYGWNPSNIMGLVELYRTTRDKRYLELAGIFVDMRGSAEGGSDLTQDRVPLRRETQAVGHCVCAGYLYCGAADVAAETGDKALRAALERIWQNVTQRRMYLTGAVGSFRNGKSTRGDSVHEAFGRDYELPSRTAYNETCANIANAMWNWRMLTLTGEAKYADVMERVLYNSMLSAVGTDGKGFFYCNPLSRNDSRAGLSFHHTPSRWSIHRCYCCPPSVVRTVAKLHGWAYSVSRDTLWVNLYGGSALKTKLPDGSTVGLSQQSDYPWDGRVTLTVDEAPDRPLAVMLRVPGWAEGARLTVNGRRDASVGALRAGTYAAVKRKWSAGETIELTLPMEVRLIEAHPAVKSLRGKVAVMRGPIVYCLESPDVPKPAAVWDVALPADVKLQPQHRKELLGGVTVLRGRAFAPRQAEPQAQPAAPKRGDWDGVLYRPLADRRAPRSRGRAIEITLIPYYAWANRGVSQMTVWMPLAR